MWLQRDFGIYIANLFDTGQAARVLGLPASLAGLLKHFCGIIVRPLPLCPATWACCLLYAPGRLYNLSEWGGITEGLYEVTEIRGLPAKLSITTAPYSGHHCLCQRRPTSAINWRTGACGRCRQSSWPMRAPTRTTCSTSLIACRSTCIQPQLPWVLRSICGMKDLKLHRITGPFYALCSWSS